MIPILMYHEVSLAADLEAVSRRTQRNYVVSVEQFAAHLDALRAAGVNSISLDQLVAWQAGKAVLPPKPVVITFDDGFEGNHRHALPLLLERGLSATVFVVSNWIGRAGMMSPKQLREFAAAGMGVQSHTASHPLLSTLDALATRTELSLSKSTLEQVLGMPVLHVALPHGDSNGDYARLAREVGYASGCSSVVGRNYVDTDPYFLRRVAVTSGMSAATIAALATNDAALYATIERRARIKRAISRVMGKRLYGRLVDLVYGVQAHGDARE